MKPLAIELFSGLHGFGEAASDVGYRVVGFDLYDMPRMLGFPLPKGDIQLVLQDVLTLHGSQFKDAAFIWASPPCQFFSYTAMPWSKARALAAAVRADPAQLEERLALFNACFRIRREASEAAKHHVPMVIENVVGAQKWVGDARWHFGSYYLWGDVPALMPFTYCKKNNGGGWFGQRDGKELTRNDPRDMRRNGDGKYMNATAQGGWNHPGKALDGRKNRGSGSWFPISHGKDNGAMYGDNPVCTAGVDGSKARGDWFGSGENCSPMRMREEDWRKWIGDGQVKQPGLSGPAWFDRGVASQSSRSHARKAASAAIAKIPYDLAHYIASVYLPR